MGTGGNIIDAHLSLHLSHNGDMRRKIQDPGERLGLSLKNTYLGSGKHEGLV